MVFYISEHTIIKKFRIKLQWGLPQCIILFIQPETGLNDGKF